MGGGDGVWRDWGGCHRKASIFKTQTIAVLFLRKKKIFKFFFFFFFRVKAKQIIEIRGPRRGEERATKPIWTLTRSQINSQWGEWQRMNNSKCVDRSLHHSRLTKKTKPKKKSVLFLVYSWNYNNRVLIFDSFFGQFSAEYREYEQCDCKTNCTRESLCNREPCLRPCVCPGSWCM